MKYVLIYSITLLLMFLPSSVFAQSSLQDGKDAIGTITPPAEMNAPSGIGGTGAISRYIGTLLNIALIFGVIGALIYLVYGGIQWIMAGGDPKALDQARATITNALIGTILLACALAISYILQSFIGAGLGTSPCPRLPPDPPLPC